MKEGKIVLAIDPADVASADWTASSDTSPGHDFDLYTLNVHLTDGRVLSSRVLIARGDRRNPLSEEDLRAKFRTSAGQALTPAKVAALEKAIARVSDMGNIGELNELLVP